jgi:hypothetical protein
MSRFPRFRRRPDHWASPHERARARAAERLDGPLGLTESQWLDEHLADCRACAAIAASYEADRLALRTLRDLPPEPPRDLWARTGAAIERESRSAGQRRPARADGGRRLPIGVLSGVAVVAVVVAVSAVSGGLLGSTPQTALTDLGTPGPVPTPARSAAAPTSPVAAAATPFDVGAGVVQWFGKDPDGQLAYNAASIRKVCPADSMSSCANVDDSVADRLPMTSSAKSIIGSPTQQQAVVVSDDGAGGQRITVLSLPAADATPVPTASSSPSAAASVTPEPTAPPSEVPSPTATASEPTATEGTESPTATASPSADATPSNEPTSTPAPTTSVAPSAAPTATPVLTPEPTVALTLAIANNITVVGEGAAFSADGEWFAFTARPTDGSRGPDVYVWRVGDKSAHRLTEDGATYFASWDGATVVASRGQALGDTVDPNASADPSATATATETNAQTVRIDPSGGAEQPAGDLWRPVVDPTESHAVGWTGTVANAPDGLSVAPSDGRLELRRWSARHGASSGSGAAQIVARGPVTDFDVRWDESGTWFAVWVADPSGTEVGRLSLFHVDPTTGLLDHPDGAPSDVAALPGFSIGQGRLAWATPPGQGGEGSRVQIVAWADDGVGTVETAPGEGLIVVR